MNRRTFFSTLPAPITIAAGATAIMATAPARARATILREIQAYERARLSRAAACRECSRLCRIEDADRTEANIRAREACEDGPVSDATDAVFDTYERASRLMLAAGLVAVIHDGRLYVAGRTEAPYHDVDSEGDPLNFGVACAGVPDLDAKGGTR